jgi:uncharacterized membrane protein YdbT with pleckstrin-like domain
MSHIESYVDEVLQPGEHVEYQARLHPIIFFPSFLVFGVGVGFLASGSGRVSVILILLSFLSIFGAWLIWRTTEIAVTDQRVIYKTGYISRKTIEMNRNKIESVEVSQSVLGRLFNYGTVTVRGTGMGIEPIRNIEAPLAFSGFVTPR